jgi:tetratricopeptide (TPR) repeat protein
VRAARARATIDEVKVSLSLATILVAVLAMASPASADLGPARAALASGQYAQAEPLLRAATGRERAEADLLLVQLLLETGRYADARSLAQRLSRVPATRAQGLTLEGESLAQTGQYDDAIARWRQALDPRRVSVARRARALAALWSARLGRRDDAEEFAQPLIDEYNDAMQEEEDRPSTPARPNPRTASLRDAEALGALGVAMRALGSAQDANDAFNAALRVDARRVDTLVDHSELYLSKEDMEHAGESLRDALAVNPRHARALLGRARTRLASEMDFAKAGEDLDAALAINPALAEAFALRAQMVLRDEDIAGADRLTTQALGINPRSLDALATRAVTRFIADDMAGFRRALDEVFRVSSVYVEAYALLAEFADWTHRYEEAAGLLREGLQRPEIARDRRLQGWMRAQLGMNLLRTGAEEEGLAELQESFRQDRYNVRVYNLLNLYEDTITSQYATETHGPFVLRMHNEERAILGRYVPRLLTQAYQDMVRRYRFTPRGPLRVELFADSEHFSVRTAGLPEIGVQGVCFGKVITAISPRAASFNWAQILWHELAHVFAIQLSRSRVPRWFTEGLSEWESFHSHPEWAREMDRELLIALEGGRVPRVAEMNVAFTHARSGDDVLVAYYAASKLVEFMIDRFTFDRVIALLPLWGQGLATPEVIQRGLGVGADEVDRLFREHTTQRLRAFRGQWSFSPSQFRERERLEREASAPTASPEQRAKAAAAAFVADRLDVAGRFAEQAIAGDPNNVLARYIRAMLAMGRRDPRGAMSELEVIFRARVDGYALRVFEWQLSGLLRDNARHRSALEAAVRLDPTQPEPHRLLASLHREQGRAQDELLALQQVVRLDQHDRESLRTLLARLAAAARWQDIRALAEHARALDPEEAQTHVTLGRAYGEGQARADAILEYESALILEPPTPLRVTALVGLARVHLAAGDRRAAERRAREARQADPNHAEARALASQLGLR